VLSTLRAPWRAGQPELSTRWFTTAQRQRVVVFGALTLLATVAACLLVLALPVGTATAVVVWLVLIAVAWEPRVGLLVTLAMVGFYENNSPDQMMIPGQYFYSGLGSYVGMGGILPSPIELLLGLSAVIWFVKGLVRHRFDFRPGTLKWPMALFALAILLGTLRGFVGRGQLNFILWEVRFLVYMVVCYYLATNTIRTRTHVRWVVAISLVTMTLFGMEGVYRKLALIDTGVIVLPMEFAYSHESVIFWGSLILLVIAQFTFGAPAWQRLLGAIGLPLCMAAMLLSERRSGQIGMIMGFLALTLVFLMIKRKAFYFFCVPVILAFLVYLPIFWNNTSPLGQPARAIRSLKEPDPRDFASNLYREMEKINIYTTIRRNPLVGVGFGRPFIVVVQMIDVSWWPLWNYQPHNNIMWIWIKMGPAGYILFWTVMGGGLMRSAYLAKKMKSPEAKVFALLTLSALMTTLVFDYVDLALTGPRATVLIGTLLGTLAVLEKVFDEAPPALQPTGAGAGPPDPS
jgi:O-Antigen ligase